MVARKNILLHCITIVSNCIIRLFDVNSDGCVEKEELERVARELSKLGEVDNVMMTITMAMMMMTMIIMTNDDNDDVKMRII